MIRFRITVSGLGGIAVPLAKRVKSRVPSGSVVFLNKSTLQGAKTIGQKADAMTDISCLRNFMNLSLSP